MFFVKKKKLWVGKEVYSCIIIIILKYIGLLKLNKLLH